MQKTLFFIATSLFLLIPSAISIQASTVGLCMHISAASGLNFVDIDSGTFSVGDTHYSIGPTKGITGGTHSTMNFYAYGTSGASSIGIAFSGSPQNSRFINSGVLIGTVVSATSGAIQSITSYVPGCQNYRATSTPAMIPSSQVPPIINTSKINNTISFGMRSADVITLQNYLISIGLLKSSATGYFGSLTLSAVKQFQTENDISPVGNVGPITRGVINSKL